MFETTTAETSIPYPGPTLSNGLAVVSIEGVGQYYTSEIRRIDPVVKAEWIKALLSGDYKQGTGTLRDEADGFCCLGVYCDIAKVPVEHLTDEIDGVRFDSRWTYGDGGDKNSSYIPTRYAIGGTFNGTQPVVVMYSPFNVPNYYDLSELNDSGFTFAQIADVINYFL